MPRESPGWPQESPHEAVRGSPGLTGNSARCPVTACDSRTAPLRLFWDSLKLQCLNKIGQQISVGIWVSYVTSCYVISCSVCPGISVAWGEGGVGRGGGTMRFSIGQHWNNLGTYTHKRILPVHIIINGKGFFNL